jgi:two-component system sensor histidine kinase YesM
MAKVGDENLMPFTKLLGEYFRFITRNAADFVPLKEEVDHARTYAEIQQMRFPRRLNVEFEACPKALEALSVPRLILQPVIENAFKHGVEKKTNGGLVIVQFEPGQDWLGIVVEDNGDELTDAALQSLERALYDDADSAETTGLINIHRRLRILYGEAGGLLFARNEMGGLSVTIRIGTTGGEANAPVADCR